MPTVDFRWFQIQRKMLSSFTDAAGDLTQLGRIRFLDASRSCVTEKKTSATFQLFDVFCATENGEKFFYPASRRGLCSLIFWLRRDVRIDVNWTERKLHLATVS